MLKKNPKKDRQDDLFRPRLENIIDPRHELVKLALMIDWDGLEGLYCLAVCQRKQKKRTKSLATLDQVLASAPDHGRAYQERGFIHQAMTQPSKAIAAFEKAVDLNPALFGSWRALANEPSYSRRQNAQQHVTWLSSLPPNWCLLPASYTKKNYTAQNSSAVIF